MSVSSATRFVLVGTTHPGNIGAAARAMKVMGLRRLTLVRPKRFPCAEATAMASGADDVLANAEIYDSLAEALRDCRMVAGCTARERAIAWPVMDPRGCAAKLNATAVDEAAIVFGREHAGLTNDEVEQCNLLVRIPSVADFSSLNLAAAVQIMAYELFLAAHSDMAPQPNCTPQTPLATVEEMDRLYSHLEQTMEDVGFYDPDKPRRLKRRLRRLFNRAELHNDEAQILRGFLAAVQSKARNK